MSQEPSQAQPDAQASRTGQAAGAGAEVGGVRSSREGSGMDLRCLDAQTSAWLKARSRDSAGTHAWQRSEGQGDGPASAGITTPEQVRKLQRTLDRKAKAQPGYRFWSLKTRSGTLAMQRLGKPDTGNPSVRFDEGWSRKEHWQLRPVQSPLGAAYSAGAHSLAKFRSLFLPCLA